VTVKADGTYSYRSVLKGQDTGSKLMQLEIDDDEYTSMWSETALAYFEVEP
jgi:hypothetical protein